MTHVQQNWRKLVITQVCSGSVSLVASSAIVTFIYRKGLSSSPYRRIIFGLSLSDIFRSFALVAGPWLIRSDAPQAHWGIGNKHTCRMDGFLFLVGVTAVPMYTLCLCIYHVCKLKLKMTDEQFAHKIENKMHFIIVTMNLGLHLTAIGMDTMNPGVNGSICLSDPVPTGCRISPEMYGDCDPKTNAAALFFMFMSSAIVPICCLIAGIGCLAIIFWNVLLREKIFGSAGANENVDHASTMGPGPIPPSALRRRSRYALPFPDSSDLTLSQGGDGGEDEKMQNVEIRTASDSNKNVEFHTVSDLKSSGEEDLLSNFQETKNTEVASSSMPLDGRSAETGERETIETLSRRYKRELLSQACCYVLILCLNILPLFNAYKQALGGVQVSHNAYNIAIIGFYSLGGLFNIIVYTRPNITGFRRRHPVCSRLQAFWLVLKAGGEAPSEDEWDDTLAWSMRICARCCLYPMRQSSIRDPPPEDGNEEHNGVIEHTCNDHGDVSREIVSDVQFGISNKDSSSLPDSAAGMDGMSMSMDSGDACYRSAEDWNHVEGRTSRMSCIPEGSTTCSKDEESSSGIVCSSRESERTNEKEDIWAATFERAMRWQPSQSPSQNDKV